MLTHAARAAAAVTGSVLALAFAGPAGAAGQSGTTQTGSFDPTGAVFSCPSADYTITGGTVHQIMHDSFDGQGGEHVTGTISPTGVTLTDGTTDTVYHLAGATWFGGNFVGDHWEFTDTGHFNILAPSGGTVGVVGTVEHAGSNGNSFSFTFGPCSAPNN